MFAIRELLEDCGWFNEYTVGIVTDIHYEEGFGFYLNISESNWHLIMDQSIKKRNV